MKCWFCKWDINNTFREIRVDSIEYYSPYIPLMITEFGNKGTIWICPHCKMKNYEKLTQEELVFKKVS
jgi:hypothetical protein